MLGGGCDVVCVECMIGMLLGVWVVCVGGISCVWLWFMMPHEVSMFPGPLWFCCLCGWLVLGD